MKSLLTCLLVLFGMSLTQAQWVVGPKVSLGVVTQKSAQIPIFPVTDYLTYDLSYMGSSSVRSVGLMAFNNLGPIFLQAEALATQYNLEYAVLNYKQKDAPSYYREGYFKLELPVAAGVNIDQFKIGLGPVFEYNISKDSELETMDSYIDRSKKMDFGFQGLIGYRFGNIHIDLRYVNKFSSIVEDFAFGYDEFRYKKGANRCTMSVGMMF